MINPGRDQIGTPKRDRQKQQAEHLSTRINNFWPADKIQRFLSKWASHQRRRHGLHIATNSPQTGRYQAGKAFQKVQI
jgi:hypothetical protein